MHSRAGGDVHVKQGTLFLTDIGITVFIISGHLNVRCGFVCVCMCVFLILEWIMRCKQNSNYSDLYSNLYMLLYQRNLLRTFIFKIQKCFKVLMSNSGNRIVDGGETPSGMWFTEKKEGKEKLS